jgi:hypothetical protein
MGASLDINPMAAEPSPKLMFMMNFGDFNSMI